MSAPGRHRASARIRRRRVVAAGAGLLVVGGGLLAFLLLRDAGVERFCGRPEDLVTVDGVSLTADAMEAFEEAEASVGPVEVVESYRSCREQSQACEGICGDRRGCPDLCAPPGFSWHQRGLAIDLTQGMLDTVGVVEALESAGWCQALPDSDPGHFSFDGCH
jgi:hypothetical protein